MLINITGGPDLTLHEINEAASIVREEADEDANIIFGHVIDETMAGRDEDHRHCDRIPSRNGDGKRPDRRANAFDYAAAIRAALTGRISVRSQQAG